MMAANGSIVDPDIVVRQSANGIAFLGHVVFGQRLAI
jgi:hypothetical protein